MNSTPNKKEMESTVSLIAAFQQNLGMGYQSGLPWRIPEDLARFKELTLNHPIVMGRKTYESLPRTMRPLPGRTNIVVTRTLEADEMPAGVTLAESIEGAFELAARAPGGERIWVIGGAQVYRYALPYADELWATEVKADAPVDTFFPIECLQTLTRQVDRQEHVSEKDGTPYAFVLRSR
jgi:dihydrofolate reductase